MCSWQTTGRGWEVIPARYLYPATLRDHLRQTYVRFFKAASLATALKLTANELAYLAAHADYRIDGQGWLNSLPVIGKPDGATSPALLTALGACSTSPASKADACTGRRAPAGGPARHQRQPRKSQRACCSPSPAGSRRRSTRLLTRFGS